LFYDKPIVEIKDGKYIFLLSLNFIFLIEAM